MNRYKNFFKKNLIEISLALSSIIFSCWLMFSTFSHNGKSMFIASKAWSDFASTIPLIRSFSLGSNFPPEYPLFPTEPIHYHFLFYYFVGLLEKIGFRIDLSWNTLSFLGFFGLLMIIYFFSKTLFKNKAVGILSVIFFLFNGSFSFIEFLKLHPISPNLLNEIISNSTFPSFGPYDGKIISAFWNLNIFSNQRHLAPSFFISLSIILFFLNYLKNKQKIKIQLVVGLGVLLGLFFFFHLAVLLSTIIVLLTLAIFFKEIRFKIILSLLIGGSVAFPQYLYLQSGSDSFKPFLNFGYLVESPKTIFSFFEYWFLNLGFHFFLIPIGFILTNKTVKKIFVAFFLIFVLGNSVQFTPEIAANHKFFNYFMLIGIMFSAFTIVKMWNYKYYFKPAVAILFFFLILSGIIDFFPIYNDHKLKLDDYKINPDIKWIAENTPRNSVFLNTEYLYTPASLAGRKIFLGWPYFSWSAGYNTLERDNLRKKILNSDDLISFCEVAENYNIRYAELTSNSEFPINYSFFEKNFNLVYENQLSTYKIYDIAC